MIFYGYFRSIEQDNSKNGNLYKVEFKNLYEDNTEKEEELILGSSPFKVKYKREFKDNNPFGLITSTATIRIVSDDCRRLFSLENTYKNPVIVSLYKYNGELSDDFTLEWKGVLSDNNFNSSWDSPLNEFEVNADCFLSSPKMTFWESLSGEAQYGVKFSLLLPYVQEYLYINELTKISFPLNRYTPLISSYILYKNGFFGKTLGECLGELAAVNGCCVLIEKGIITFFDPVAQSQTGFNGNITLDLSGASTVVDIDKRKYYKAGEYFDSTLSYSDSEGCIVECNMVGEVSSDFIEETENPWGYDRRYIVNDLRNYYADTSDRGDFPMFMLMDNGSGSSCYGIYEYLDTDTWKYRYEPNHVLNYRKTSIPKVLSFNPDDNEEEYRYAEIGFLGVRPVNTSVSENPTLDPIGFLDQGGVVTSYSYCNRIDKEFLEDARPPVGVYRNILVPSIRYANKSLSKSIAQRFDPTIESTYTDVYSYSNNKLFLPKGCLIELESSLRCSLTKDEKRTDGNVYSDFAGWSLIPSEQNQNAYKDFSIDDALYPVYRPVGSSPKLIVPVNFNIENTDGYKSLDSYKLDPVYDDGDTRRWGTYYTYEGGSYYPDQSAPFANSAFNCWNMNLNVGEYEFLSREGKERNCLFPMDEYNNLSTGLVGDLKVSFRNPINVRKLREIEAGPTEYTYYIDTYLYDNIKINMVGEEGSIKFKCLDNVNTDPYYTGSTSDIGKITKVKLNNLHFTDREINPLNQVIYTTAFNWSYDEDQVTLGYRYLDFQDTQNFYYLSNLYSRNKIQEHSFWVCDTLFPSSIIKLGSEIEDPQPEPIIGEDGDDAAAYYNNFENGWRTPTKEEFEELLNNTTQIRKTITLPNGSTVNGYLFTADNGNSLFFPAGGRKYLEYTFDEGFECNYWCSDKQMGDTLDNYANYFVGELTAYVSTANRYQGKNVRAITEDRKASGSGVDLGLPSGKLWAEKNIGAASMYDYGYYLAWGELEEKSYYDSTNYKYYDVENHHYTKYSNIWDPEKRSVLEIGKKTVIPESDGNNLPSTLKGSYTIKELDVDYEYEHSQVTTILEPDMYSNPNIDVTEFKESKSVEVENNGFKRLLPEKDYILKLEDWDEFQDITISSSGDLNLISTEVTEEQLKYGVNNIYNHLYFDVFDVREEGDLWLDLPYQLEDEDLNPNFFIATPEWEDLYGEEIFKSGGLYMYNYNLNLN